MFSLKALPQQRKNFATVLRSSLIDLKFGVKLDPIKRVCTDRIKNTNRAALVSFANNGYTFTFDRGLCNLVNKLPNDSTTNKMTAATTDTSGSSSDPKEIFRKDYQALPFTAKSVSLSFDLGDEVTKVICKVEYIRNLVQPKVGDLVLNGETKAANMVLEQISLDGRTLQASDYTKNDKTLIVPKDLLPTDDAGKFDLEIITTIQPQKNTALAGLYKTNQTFCSQCEAEGFRNITYFLDRPDNMSIYETKITADKVKYPILLSNGNDVETGDLPNGKHYVLWKDPFPKPSYLFALVAGDLAVQRGSFTTRSGKAVKLSIYVEHGREDQVDHAMESLKKSFKWYKYKYKCKYKDKYKYKYKYRDEDRFDREYDLDQFSIVAVSDFNMGAMENKSLNIFNDKYVLAKKTTATDQDFQLIEAVIGHEYFHNWSGNRVTCRDWFQLTLKEGLTVYRDQEFTSDLNSRPVKRVEDVRGLRFHQFKEDAGPMSHPIVPASYISMDNFYTSTVYEKGAEVIRMVATIVGTQGFKNGLNEYFRRYDGQAVTCDDFIRVMEDTNNVDLNQFRESWYYQNGTPTVQVTTKYDKEQKTYSVKLEQSLGEKSDFKTYDIPFAIGLVGRESKKSIKLRLRDSEVDSQDDSSILLRLRERCQEFIFDNVNEDVVPSLLRNFSAPVHVKSDSVSRADLAFLASYDSDHFNRYEAGQQLASQILLELIEKATQNDGGNGHIQTIIDENAASIQTLIDVFKSYLCDDGYDNSLKAMSVTLPPESRLAELVKPGTANAGKIHSVCMSVKREIAVALKSDFLRIYKEQSDIAKQFETVASGRSIKNRCLAYLLIAARADMNAFHEPSGFYSKLKTNWETEYPEAASLINLAFDQLTTADNMTDMLGVLNGLIHLDCAKREVMLDNFYETFKNDPLVVCKWLTLNAHSSLPDTIERMKAIMKKTDVFTLKNPNQVYSFIRAFSGNWAEFHRADGEGYKLVADAVIELDAINPQVASRIVGSLTDWKKFSSERGELMKAQLERINSQKLSDDVFEKVSKSLKEDNSKL